MDADGIPKRQEVPMVTIISQSVITNSFLITLITILFDLLKNSFLVFRYKFHPNMFLWKEGDFGGISRFSYTYEASLKGLPDMPDWLKYRYSNRHKAGKKIYSIFSDALTF